MDSSTPDGQGQANDSAPMPDPASNGHAPDQSTQAATPDLLGKDADDAGNAQFMHRLYGEQFLFCPAFGWLEWTGAHWKAGADAAVERVAVNALRRRRHLAVDTGHEEIVRATKGNLSRVRGCVELFRVLVTEPDPAVFDADPDLLNCLEQFSRG